MLGTPHGHGICFPASRRPAHLSTVYMHHSHYHPHLGFSCTLPRIQSGHGGVQVKSFTKQPHEEELIGSRELVEDDPSAILEDGGPLSGSRMCGRAGRT